MTDAPKLTDEKIRDRAARAVWDTLGADFTFDEALSGQEKATHAEAIKWVYTVADTVIRAVSAERDTALARAEAAEEKAAEAALSALQAYGQAETADDAQKAAEAERDRLRKLVRQIQRAANEWLVSRHVGDPDLEQGKGDALWKEIRRASGMIAPIEPSTALTTQEGGE